jgi:hypothetical protein
MNIKIIGVGKCGSRICYDFFAHISGLPSAYEIRIQPNRGAISKLFDNVQNAIGFRERLTNWRREWQSLTGTELLKDVAWYAIVDSDVSNNEITQSVVVFSEPGAPRRQTVFPGTSHNLSNHTGGCDFHVVSENICQTWLENQIPDPLRTREEAEIVSYAFSIGGGTGGGASIPLASKLRKQIPVNGTSQVHLMGLGILPESDERYFTQEQNSEMDPHEKYNVGRFFTGWYGERNKSEARRYFDSLWLVSNDCLHWLQQQDTETRRKSESETDKKKMLNRRGISLINMSLSGAICTLCNSSSKGTTSSANFDAMEMNNRLNGNPFISAFSHGKADANNDAEKDTAHVHQLFRGAVSNPWIKADQLLGLSVPQRSREMAALDRIFGEELFNPSELRTRIDKYRPEEGPMAFRTAEKVVVLYGQSDANTSDFRTKLIRQLANGLFPNSDISFYGYKHSGETEYLVLLIVNPFISAVQNAMYYYLQRVWLKNLDDGPDFLDDLISSSQFDENALMEKLEDQERLEPGFLGETTLGIVEKIGKRWPFTREHVVQAVKRLHDIYHHKKTSVKHSKLGMAEIPGPGTRV